jgi:Ca2+-binding RTX toxin-like protein
MKRLLGTLLAALALAALSPAQALGWTAFRMPGSSTLFYLAESGEANDVTISLASGTYTITDLGVGVTAAPVIATPCTRVDDTTVTCPAPGITDLDVTTSDQNDRAALAANTPARIFGGDGDDDLAGGGGNDVIAGDGVLGEVGSDRLVGGGGDDQLFGKSADVGADGPNDLDGGPGRDDLWGAAGPDAIAGGPGDDTLRGFEGDDSGNGGDGADFVTGGDGNDFFDGGPGNDTLGSAAVFMLIVPEWGDDRFDGGAGDDLIRPGPGPSGGTTDSDALNGGEGRDVVTYGQRVEDLAISQDGQANDGGMNERDNVGVDVERVEGGASDDQISGSAGSNEIDGGPGADVIEGADGADTLDGGATDGESDTLRGGGGPDLLRGNAGDDALDGGPDADDLQGGDGDDGVEGGEGDDTVTGGAGIDDLRGGQGDDGLHGEEGSDTLGGDAGDDELRGGGGDDVLSGGRNADLLGGGADTDTADYGIAARGLTVSLDGAANDGQRGERDNVQSDIENVIGAGLEDTFTGSDDPNRLDGGAGEDYLDGAGGAGDAVIGGSAIDVLRLRDNGRRDEARCGSGSDFVIADRADRVSGNCERRDNGVGNVPELGSEVVVRPVRGSNEFGLPAMHRTVPLEDRINVPVGTEFDTRGRAAVRIVAAGTPEAGSPRAIAAARSAGVFSGGRFTVLQRRSRDPVTELRLRGGNFSRCRRGARRGATAAQARRPIRRLRGRSGRGYRTRGRRSSATVRGTAWEVVDRCDGTLTRVFEGIVEVFDFGLGRTITLRAGQSYLARAR